MNKKFHERSSGAQRIKLILVFAVISAFICSPLLAKTEKEQELERLLAESYAADGEYEKAIDMYGQQLEKEPGNIKARIALADTLSWMQKYDESIAEYKKVLEIDPANLEAKEKLAGVLSWDKRYDESIALYDEILKEKEDIGIWRQKARVLGWAKQHGKAIKEYQKILDKQDDKLTELEMKAKKAYWTGRVKTAIDYYDQLIELDPKNVEAMFDLAQIYSYQSMWEQAEREYENILDISPTHFRAKEGLRKTELISKHISLKSAYRFFEADSTSRDTDIRKHQFLSTLEVPLGYKMKMDIDYELTGRSFADFHDIIENKGRVKITYLNGPDWQANAYYGLIGYNKDIDELTHLFGGNLTFRVLDLGTFSSSYDRERLENTSEVIRRHFHRDNLLERLNIDVTERLKIAMDYIYSHYSDGNYKNEPGFDILYYLSIDPMRLTVKYRYFYREFNKKVSEYFSPKGFSTNIFALNWRHYLNKEEIFFGADDLYYDLDYTVTIDSLEIVGHTFSWEFNWDLNKRLNFNVKGSVTGSSANVYKESGVTAGIKYYF
jgi:tetratricopeptide (TPR) repeat protein